MREHPWLRAAQYIAEWMGVLTTVVLVVVFSLTGWMLPPPDGTLSYVSSDSGFSAENVRPVLLALFLFAMAADGILLMLARVPGMFRYPVEVTASNVEAQYVLGKVSLGAMTCGTNICVSIAMILIYRLSVRIDGWNTLWLTAVLAGYYAVSWLVYYLVARQYR